MRVWSDERESEAAAESGLLFVWGALALCAVFLFGLTISACLSHPVEETVTTDVSRSSAVPPGTPPKEFNTNLPQKDADIEAAGDRIAEAITRLNSRHRERREAALRALNQAEAALNRAQRSKAADTQSYAAIRSALKDLDAAERAVQRGAPDAVKQLAALNRSLDDLTISQQ